MRKLLVIAAAALLAASQPPPAAAQVSARLGTPVPVWGLLEPCNAGRRFTLTVVTGSAVIAYCDGSSWVPLNVGDAAASAPDIAGTGTMQIAVGEANWNLGEGAAISTTEGTAFTGGVTADDLTATGAVTLSGVTNGTTGAGAVPAGSIAAGVVASERGVGLLRQTVLTLTAVAVTITDATTAGAHGAIQLYDYPAGLLTMLGATSDLSVTAGAGGIGDTAAVVCALGSATVGVDNATLTSTEADSIPSTAATLSGGVGACDGQATASLLADGTATPADLYLNLAVPDAGITDGQNDTLTVAGTITFTWLVHGDN